MLNIRVGINLGAFPLASADLGLARRGERFQ
jgi:hypothetical protein